MFVHHVFFYLKNPDSAADKAQLIAGLQTMTGVAGLTHYHIGKVADTDRPVINRTYSLSWLTIFESKEAHDAYQDVPVHHQFVRDCAHLWEKVVIYDSDDL
jgi:Stress responsive A/B Barrel Domain